MKTYFREQKNVLTFFDDKLRWTGFKFPVPETIEEQWKTDSKAFKDKLVLNQEAIHESVVEMVDTVIKIL